MRENRPSGSEGGGTFVLPTPISGGIAAHAFDRFLLNYGKFGTA
jgi:hypothetical protein